MHTRIRQSKITYIWHTTSGKHHGIRLQLAAIIQLRHYLTFRCLDQFNNIGVQTDINALLDHLPGQRFLHVMVKATQNLLATIDLHNISAQSIENPGELTGNKPATDNDDTLRQGLEVKCLI